MFAVWGGRGGRYVVGRDWERDGVTYWSRLSVEDRWLQDKEERFRECVVFGMYVCICVCLTSGSPAPVSLFVSLFRLSVFAVALVAKLSSVPSPPLTDLPPTHTHTIQN